MKQKHLFLGSCGCIDLPLQRISYCTAKTHQEKGEEGGGNQS